MRIFHREISLEDGFDVLDNPKENRLVKGKLISACSGWQLFKSLQGNTISCYNCGCEADRWIVDKGKNDFQGLPVLNLYGTYLGQLILMNRDHIIPKSLGGTDALENLRPACEVCNSARGNRLTQEDLYFRAANPHLISEVRLAIGKNNASKSAALLESKIEKEKILEPFHLIATNTALVSK